MKKNISVDDQLDLYAFKHIHITSYSGRSQVRWVCNEKTPWSSVKRVSCTYGVCMHRGAWNLLNFKTLQNGIKWLENNYCLSKSVERISVRTVTEKLAQNGIYCLPCSAANDVIYLLPKQLWVYINVYVETSMSANVLSTTVGSSIVAMVTDVWRHLTCSSE